MMQTHVARQCISKAFFLKMIYIKYKKAKLIVIATFLVALHLLSITKQKRGFFLEKNPANVAAGKSGRL